MFCELSDPGIIKVQGKEAKKFLQGQLTCNVDTRTPCMGAHCNREGRVISLFYLYPSEHDFYLVMPHEMVAITISALKKYAVFFKTEITDESKTPEAMDLIKDNINEGWKLRSIRNGIPAIYPETSGKFLPHELDLHNLNAIDFDKGCYIGQEIIARMHYRGKLKNHLYKAETGSGFLPKRGADIFTCDQDGWHPKGKVVDFAPDVYNAKYHLLLITNETQQDLYLTEDKDSLLTIETQRK